MRGESTQAVALGLNLSVSRSSTAMRRMQTEAQGTYLIASLSSGRVRLTARPSQGHSSV